MKRHWKHFAMCSPMILVAVVLLATGADVGTLIPVAACVLMMSVMMGWMHGGGKSGDHSHHER